MRTLPGEIAHADLMTRSVPGLIPPMVGFLTSKKFHCTSFFVEDRSECTFACHQETTTSEEIITAKKTCESDLRKYGKEARNYDAGNGTCATVRNKEEIEK